MEFQEILTILIYGPSIFFFVMKTHVSLDQPLTLEYRRGDEVINEYESSTTTRQALVQTLASIDATMKPTGIVLQCHENTEKWSSSIDQNFSPDYAAKST